MKRKGTIWIGLGVFFLLLDFMLVGWNLTENNKANDTSKEAEKQLENRIQKSILQEEVFPDIEMPVETIHNNEYIGILEIPSLELRLPIISQWSYPKLRIAPCRYSGTAYKSNFIILAHNYASHFGKLKNLSMDSIISFTDIDGNVFLYQVVQKEILQPEDVEALENSNWDMTLFTCTIGGKSRVTIRCKRLEV